MAPDASTIVFLHIPKTAGQSIHSELQRVVGSDAVSPIRVHTEAGPGEAQMPAGYRLYSGHIDWAALETLPRPRFTFTVLRDPLERIASFYFYIRRQAEALSPEDLARPGRVGMRMALNETPDTYFCGGTPVWQKFIRDHYHTQYCAYLATRRIRGYSAVSDWPTKQLVARALEVAGKLDGVYSVDRLDALERDVKDRLGYDINVTGTRVNAAPEAPQTRRWPQLEAMIEQEQTHKRLLKFARSDQMLMYRLGLGEKPERPGG